MKTQCFSTLSAEKLWKHKVFQWFGSVASESKVMNPQKVTKNLRFFNVFSARRTFAMGPRMAQALKNQENLMLFPTCYAKIKKTIWFYLLEELWHPCFADSMWGHRENIPWTFQHRARNISSAPSVNPSVTPPTDHKNTNGRESLWSALWSALFRHHCLFVFLLICFVHIHVYINWILRCPEITKIS